MPKSNSGSKGQPLALELLMADHRKVEGLFESYEKAKEAEDEGRVEIARRICGELTVHAQVEEELFYPWLRENLEDDEREMVEEAEVEHSGAKDLIAQIEASTEVDAPYDAKVKVLSEYIKHHVKEEENEIFPEVRGEKDVLDELGQEMTARKAELLEELGLSDDEAAAAPRGGRKGSQPAARR
jgi:iron-sulfur cluster repair protein YtfE (RIC family)